MDPISLLSCSFHESTNNHDGSVPHQDTIRCLAVGLGSFLEQNVAVK